MTSICLHVGFALLFAVFTAACGSSPSGDANPVTAAGAGATPSTPPPATGGAGARSAPSQSGTTGSVAPRAGQGAAVVGGGGTTALAGQNGAGNPSAAGSAGTSTPTAGQTAAAIGGNGAAGEAAPTLACNPADKTPDAMPVTKADEGMPPTGPFKVVLETEPSLTPFTIYRPMDLTQRATFPVIVWENGGCSLDGLLFDEFLKEIASYGVMIIVDGAPNGSGMGMLGVDGKTLLQAMDWATKENDRPCSKWYRKLEPNNIAAMGQSCGGLHAYAVAKDPRVSTVVIWNSGLLDADQSLLDGLHAPMAYFIGGMDDVSYPNADRDFKNITKAIPIFYGNLDVGHLATYDQDNGGEFGHVGAAWIRWQLLHDEGPDAKGMFAGADCGLCKTKWVIEKKNMD
jgi:hypothetical protein